MSIYVYIYLYNIIYYLYIFFTIFGENKGLRCLLASLLLN